MIHAIAVLAIGLALGGMAILSARLGGPVWGIIPLVLTLAGWTAIVAALGQTQTDQLCELVIAAASVGAALWRAMN